MTVDRATLLFVDSACLVAATGSPRGGSSLILRLGQASVINLTISPAVVLEAERNVLKKQPPEAVQRFWRLMYSMPFLATPIPSLSERQAVVEVSGHKDAHVLAAALEVGANFLVTLDRRLVQAVNDSAVPVIAVTPGEFITQYLPTHPDYASARLPQ